MMTKKMERNEMSALALLKTAVLGLLVLLAISCSEDKVDADTTLEDQESVLLDNMDEYYLEDADNLVEGVLESESGSSGGKVASEEDARLVCAEVTKTGSEESGIITIDFGDGCEDGKGNVRTGKLIVEFSGRWFIPGSFWSIEFDNYSINGVTISGIRTVSNISENTDSLVFEIKMDVLVVWPDGTEVRRKIHRKRHRLMHDNNILDRLIAYATEEINHRNGRGFFVRIIEPLVYNERCAELGVFIPVEGKKLIKHGRREITVDYGDGSCDNIVVITNKAGRSWRYEVGK